MSGRGHSRNPNRGGRGGRGGGRGRGRGSHYTGNARTTAKGLCAALGTNVFDYGQKGSADQMRTSWEKLVQYAGTTYGQDISNELKNKKEITIPEPEHTDDVKNRHAAREQLVKDGIRNIQAARKQQEIVLEKAVSDGTDPDAGMKLAILQNEIAQADYELSQEVPIELTDSEKTQYNNAWRTYRERNTTLIKHRGQAFSLIIGQCTQYLQDRMKQDKDWTPVNTSYDPLRLERLIEKTVLAQTEDQYPFATAYDQEMAIYSFRQESMSNAQWYEKFNTRVDVSKTIGITRQHKVLLNFVSQEIHNKDYQDLTDAAEQQAVRDDAEERYLSCIFLRQSRKQHAKLKLDMQNDFTSGSANTDTRYPRTRQRVLHLLDKYSKMAVTKPPSSEGASFAQKGGKGKKKQDYDVEYWKDKTCFNCGEKGHPASHCPKDDTRDKKKPKDDDDKSVASVKQLKKEFKNVNKALTTINTQLQQIKEDTSDISESEAEEDSHFQIGTKAFQFATVGESTPVNKIFKKTDRQTL